MCCSCFIFELHRCKTKNFSPWSQLHNNTIQCIKHLNQFCRETVLQLNTTCVKMLGPSYCPHSQSEHYDRTVAYTHTMIYMSVSRATCQTPNVLTHFVTCHEFINNWCVLDVIQEISVHVKNHHRVQTFCCHCGPEISLQPTHG